MNFQELKAFCEFMEKWRATGKCEHICMLVDFNNPHGAVHGCVVCGEPVA